MQRFVNDAAKRIADAAQRAANAAQAFCLYAALTIVPGIAVHLSAEALALRGTESLQHFLLRHLYLALIALAIFIASYCIVMRPPPQQRRRAVLRIFQAMPRHGAGRRGYLASVAAQCAFYGTTFAGEYQTLSVQKCVFSFLVAVVCALVAAFVLSALPAAVLRICQTTHILRRARSLRTVLANDARALLRRMRRYTGDYLAVAGNRPPPRSFDVLSQ